MQIEGEHLWGWVTFHRLHWQRENGTKYYEAVFRLDHDDFSWTETTIRFWTAHIHKALKQICNTPLTHKDLLQLEGTEYNTT